MEELATYLLKSAAVLAVFVLIYHFLLRRLTFFQANRFFLLFGLFASIAFPLVEITQTVYVEQTEAVFIPSNFATPTAAALEMPSQEIHEPLIETESLLYLLYSVIGLFFLGKIIIELASLARLIRSGEKIRLEQFFLVSLSRKLTPFSFFHYICHSRGEEKTPEFDLIINHEKVHARQWHSLDVILSNIYCAVFWFNPLAWWIKRQITENLEFIADAEAKAANTSSISYERTLLSVLASQPQPALANNFFTPSIKKRIVMLQKETSARWHAYKYALILPVIVIFLYSFNVVEKIEYIDNKEDVNKVVENDSFEDKNYIITKEITDRELEQIQSEINANDQYVVSRFDLTRNEQGDLLQLKVTMHYHKDPDDVHTFSLGNDKISQGPFEVIATVEKLKVGILDTEFYITATPAGIKMMEDLFPNQDYNNEKMGDDPLYVFEDKKLRVSQMPKGISFNADMVEMLYPTEAVKKYGNEAKDGAYIYYGAYFSEISKKPANPDSEVLIIKITKTTTREQLDEKVKRLKDLGVKMEIKKAKYKNDVLVHLKFSINDQKGFSAEHNHDTTDGVSPVCMVRTKNGDDIDWSVGKCDSGQAYFISDDLVKDAYVTITDAKALEEIAEAQSKIAKAQAKIAMAQQDLAKINMDSAVKAMAISNMKMDSLIMDLEIDFPKVNMDSLKRTWKDKTARSHYSVGNIRYVDTLAMNDFTLYSYNYVTPKAMDLGDPARSDNFPQTNAYGKYKVLSSSLESKPLVIINGKSYTVDQMRRLPANRIKSVNILKGEEATANYGEKGKNGVIIVEYNGEVEVMDEQESTTTVYGSSYTGREMKKGDPVYIVNGKMYQEDISNRIPDDKIKSITVLSAENAVERYGAIGGKGVIAIDLDGELLKEVQLNGRKAYPMSIIYDEPKDAYKTDPALDHSDFFLDFDRKMLENYADQIAEQGYELKIRTFRERDGKVKKLKINFEGSTYTIQAENKIESLTFKYYKDGRKPVMTSRSI